jgi:hypothetical protein
MREDIQDYRRQESKFLGPRKFLEGEFLGRKSELTLITLTHWLGTVGWRDLIRQSGEYLHLCKIAVDLYFAGAK